MTCQQDIENLAELKIKEAHCLFDNGFYDGAYYIGGYALELYLKAKVCKTLQITDFFLFKTGTNELHKPFKVHDCKQLLILSGLYQEHENETNADVNFKKHWFVALTWSEQNRYLTGKTKTDTKIFLTSINEICSWIKKHL